MTRYKLGTAKRAILCGESIYNTDLDNPIEEPQNNVTPNVTSEIRNVTQEIEKLDLNINHYKDGQGTFLTPATDQNVDWLQWRTNKTRDKLNEVIQILNSMRKSTN